MASVRVQKNKNDDQSNKDGKVASGGGHYIALAEPAYSCFAVMGKYALDPDDSDKMRMLTQYGKVYITHSWSAKGVTSNQRVQYTSNSDASYDEDGAVCINNLGIAPTSEVFTIDSSFHGEYNDWSRAGKYDDEDLRESPDANNPAFPGPGEFTRCLIDAQPIRKSVRDLTPSNTAEDDVSWERRWEEAKAALKRLVKNEAKRLRQMPTEGAQPCLYDDDLKLTHRVCLVGTRDDGAENEAGWMRLKKMYARINAIRLTTDNELELELTTRLALPEFSLLEYAARV